MDAYTFAFILGGAGLCLMAFTGFARFGGHSAGHVGGHAHGVGHAAGNRVAPSGRGATPHTSARGGGRFSARSALLALISPRIVFSALLGFGLTGTIASRFVGGLVLPAVSVLGAVVFERGLVAPLWNFLIRFASNPAMTFDTSLMSEARAASGFDANGQGLVAVEVDGQIVQCLGTLRPEDRALGIHVRAGDTVMIEEIDPARQRCTVSYIGQSADTSDVVS